MQQWLTRRKTKKPNQPNSQPINPTDNQPTNHPNLFYHNSFKNIRCHCCASTIREDSVVDLISSTFRTWKNITKRQCILLHNVLYGCVDSFSKLKAMKEYFTVLCKTSISHLRMASCLFKLTQS